MANSYFTKIFGNSPITPLQKHIGKVIECVEYLVPYFEAVIDENWSNAARIQAELVQRENDADEIKNQLRINLPSSLFMPVDRRDVLEVLDLQDQIANKSKDISGLILGRKMTLPVPVQATYMDFLKRCIDATHQAQVAINELDELVTTGFRGDEADRVKNMIRHLHEVEDETDELQIRLRAQLFEIEDELPPVHAVFLYKIIEWTGDLADAAQSTGNRLQLMLAK
ncbi:MAG: TIGR00153 family protein [Gammaproteobacteria bacterium]|nr:TIGR00153 family protein [Gammaproteobacteria bacterium]